MSLVVDSHSKVIVAIWPDIPSESVHFAVDELPFVDDALAVGPFLAYVPTNALLFILCVNLANIGRVNE